MQDGKQATQSSTKVAIAIEDEVCVSFLGVPCRGAKGRTSLLGRAAETKRQDAVGQRKPTSGESNVGSTT